MHYISRAAVASFIAPSFVLFPVTRNRWIVSDPREVKRVKAYIPPMNPLAWTKMQPSIPETLLSSSSRSPLHASGRAFRLSKESFETETA